MGLDRGTSKRNKRLHMSILEPSVPLRRARLRKGERWPTSEHQGGLDSQSVRSAQAVIREGKLLLG